MNGMEIAVPGHFGEFLQGRIGPVGPVALVTLPCPALRARALRLPGPFALHRPGARVLSRAGAAGLLLSLGVRPEGRFSLRLDMPAGGGAGASTAARVALARAAGVTDREAIALACLCSEGAVDPLMLDDPGRLLWASRAGYVLARLPSPLRMEIVGGFFGPMRRTDPGDAAFPDIADLSEDWPAACGDFTGAAALGFVIAHTGTARRLIFAPGIVPETTPASLRAAGFCHILRFRIGSVR